eukprot:2073793-Amphidinium_carterae.1
MVCASGESYLALHDDYAISLLSRGVMQRTSTEEELVFESQLSLTRIPPSLWRSSEGALRSRQSRKPSEEVASPLWLSFKVAATPTHSLQLH